MSATRREPPSITRGNAGSSSSAPWSDRLSRSHAETGKSAEHTKDAPLASDGSRAPTQPLDATTRDVMGSRFQHDFSAVCVHADARAADMARSAGARAYTIGSDVVFGAGEYQPHSEQGRQLIAHELAHVVQQARGGSSPDAERRADDAAAHAMRGETISAAAVGGAPVSMQAQSDPNAQPTSLKRTLSGFELNSDVPNKDHNDEIARLADSISLETSLLGQGRPRISIGGHTDTSGPDKLNDDLSQRRASQVEAVLKKALVDKKVSDAQITTAGFGEHQLAVKTKDNVREPRNRRVEIVVTFDRKPAQIPAPTFSVDRPPIVPPPGPLLPLKPPEERDRTKEKEREKQQRKIDSFDRAHKKESKSPGDVPTMIIDLVRKGAKSATDGVMILLNPFVELAPTDQREKIRAEIRKMLDAGKCDLAVKAAGVEGDKATGWTEMCRQILDSQPKGPKSP
jgi:outer membrane protein OmpA-like peptidoglycan-associated protein